MAKSFGENLDGLMRSRNLTPSTLAAKLGESVKTVREWIGAKGRMPRNPEVLKKLSEVFNVSLHYLMFGEEDPKSLVAQILEKTELHTGLYEISIKKVIPK